MRQPLQDEAILVTGASGGIGAALVKQLAADGARPVIHYGRDAQAARALLDEIGGRGWLVQADLSRDDGARTLWTQALAQTGRIHALVNNAGIRTEVALDVPDEEWRAAWQKELQVNLLSAAELCRMAVLHFREHGGGRIVNMASRAGQRGYSGTSLAYGATKAALVNLSKSIARSFGADGITAIAVAPGWVHTDMARDFVARHGAAAALADIPIGAMVEPEELAELIAFALRPSQRSLNGATLDVNGGSYIR